MRSQAQNQKRRITICLVERNTLAACYLHEIVERDSSIQILSENDILGSPGADKMVAAPIFVVDVGTLPGSLVSLLTILRSRFRDPRTLLLNEEPSSDELRRLPFLGVQGFLSYNEVRSHLCLALRTISRGDKWFSPEALKEFSRYSRTSRPEGQSDGWEHDIFTPRERLIIGLVDRRLGNKEIAVVLRISESTVKFHMANIFTKLGVRDRRSAAELAASASQW